MDDDYQVILAIRAGDESALVELMRRYREPIFRLAYRYVGNPTDAANLTEETFAKVFFNAGKFRPRGTVKSWIFAITANGCRDFLRREKRNRMTVPLDPRVEQGDGSTFAEVLPDEARNAAAIAVEKERLLEISNAIQSLPEKLRFPFIFCVLEKHPQEEAASILKTSIKTVETRIYRARRELQARLRE